MFYILKSLKKYFVNELLFINNHKNVLLFIVETLCVGTLTAMVYVN